VTSGSSGRARPRRPTIEDVARRAGVSRGTVSRVLNGGRHVSPRALAAVERAVRETGYTANPSARNLVTRRANSVAFVLTEPQDRLFDDPNVNTILRACTQALAAADIPLVLMVAGDDDERSRAVRFLNGGHADGVLLMSAHAGDPLMDMLVGSGIPVVACGKPLGHEFDIPYAAGDDRHGAQLAVRHLTERGRRRIATVTGPPDTPGGIDRLAGYRDVVGSRVPRRYVAEGDYTRDGGERAMRQLLEVAPDLEAVFVASDVAALGAMQALRRAGRRVPDDVAVVGYDDSHVAASADPPLTTVRQPFARVAAEMVRLLRDAIHGAEPSASLLPNELVVREST
jgi:DNA-binding LacI/PurR family transcriptional regulator